MTDPEADTFSDYNADLALQLTWRAAIAAHHGGTARLWIMVSEDEAHYWTTGLTDEGEN